MKRGILILIAIMSIAGCVTPKPGGPLVFVSTHTFGIDIQAATTSSATPGMTVGYKSVNVAIVPTQLIPNSGLPVQGCYAVGQNGPSSADCMPARATAGTHVKAADSKNDKTTDNSDRDSSRTTAGDTGLQYASPGHFIPVVAPVASPPLWQIQAAPPPSQNRTSPIAGANGSANPSTGGNEFSEAVVDGFSVFASFGGKISSGSGQNAIGLGELFATGDAAVQLTEGYNYYMSREGQADISKSFPSLTCMEQLIAAKNAGVSDGKLPTCPAPNSQSKATNSKPAAQPTPSR